MNSSKKVLIDKINLFWNWFSDNYFGFHPIMIKSNFPFELIRTEINKVDPAIDFEIGPVKENGFRDLIFFHPKKQDNSQIINSLVNLAPHIPNWNIVKYSYPKMWLNSICNLEDKLDLHDIQFEYQEKIDCLLLNFFIPENKNSDTVHFLLDNCLAIITSDRQYRAICKSFDIHGILSNDQSFRLPLHCLPTIIECYKINK